MSINMRRVLDFNSYDSTEVRWRAAGLRRGHSLAAARLLSPLGSLLRCVALAWLALASADHLAAGEVAVDFNRDILPLFSNSCFKCHGPDEAHREAGLRLDKLEGALAELESGELAIVPGKSEESSPIEGVY